MAKRTPATKKSQSKKTVRKPSDPAAGKPQNQLRKMFKGRELVVDIVEGGFAFDGETYKSLSALAKHIVGYGISGPNFFGVAGKPEEK